MMSDSERLVLVKDRFHYVDIGLALSGDKDVRRQVGHAINKLKIALYDTDPVQGIRDYDLQKAAEPAHRVCGGEG